MRALGRIRTATHARTKGVSRTVGTARACCWFCLRWGSRSRTRNLPDQSRACYQLHHSPSEPPVGVEPTPSRYKRAARPSSCGGAGDVLCARPDSNRHARWWAPTPRAGASACSATSAEPPPGAAPGRPPYEGGCTAGCSAARSDELLGQDSNLHRPGSEPGILPIRRPSIVCGRGDSNPHGPLAHRGLSSARLPAFRHPRWPLEGLSVVRRRGIEPRSTD